MNNSSSLCNILIHFLPSILSMPSVSKVVFRLLTMAFLGSYTYTKALSESGYPCRPSNQHYWNPSNSIWIFKSCSVILIKRTFASDFTFKTKAMSRNVLFKVHNFIWRKRNFPNLFLIQGSPMRPFPSEISHPFYDIPISFIIITFSLHVSLSYFHSLFPFQIFFSNPHPTPTSFLQQFPPFLLFFSPAYPIITSLPIHKEKFDVVFISSCNIMKERGHMFNEYRH